MSADLLEIFREIALDVGMGVAYTVSPPMEGVPFRRRRTA